jgi:putative lipoprotein
MASAFWIPGSAAQPGMTSTMPVNALSEILLLLHVRTTEVTQSLRTLANDRRKSMLGKLAELIIFGLVPLVLGGLLMPGAIAAEEVSITGEVSYRERIALPPNAVLTVRLTDVSLADAPEAVVAEQKIEPAGQVPIKFEIKLDPAVMQPNVNYALQARITVDDRLWFTNDERYSVDPSKPEPAHLVLKVVKQD